MILKPYKPYWPKTAIFWGAGATVSLGLFTTDQLAKAIWELAQRDNSIEERVLIAFGEYANEKYGSSIKNLLLLLGD